MAINLQNQPQGLQQKIRSGIRKQRMKNAQLNPQRQAMVKQIRVQGPARGMAFNPQRQAVIKQIRKNRKKNGPLAAIRKPKPRIRKSKVAAPPIPVPSQPVPYMSKQHKQKLSNAAKTRKAGMFKRAASKLTNRKVFNRALRMQAKRNKKQGLKPRKPGIGSRVLNFLHEEGVDRLSKIAG